MKRTALTLAAFLIATPVMAQNWGNPNQPGSTAPAPTASPNKGLVDELNKLIDKGSRNRLADPRYLQELRSLAQRFDWPWRKKLLEETFADGNFTANPQWTAGGDVRASWNGVRLVHIPKGGSAAAPAEQQADPRAQLLGAIFDQLNKKNKKQQPAAAAPPPTADAASLRTRLIVSNAFALKLTLASSGPANAPRRFEVGPHQDISGKDGYRLAYVIENNKARLELLRISARGSAIIDVKDGITALENGQDHQLEWRRYADGNMTVLLDGQSMMTVKDLGFRSSFNGLVLTNRTGDYTVTKIGLDGM